MLATTMRELQRGGLMDEIREVALQPTTMRELQPYKLCASARITMCILTFSSVLPALSNNVLRPLSRFRDGKSPLFGANRLCFFWLLALRAEFFGNDLINVFDGQILRRIIVSISLVTAANATERRLLFAVISANAPTPTASLGSKLRIYFPDHDTMFRSLCLDLALQIIVSPMPKPSWLLHIGFNSSQVLHLYRTVAILQSKLN